MLPLLTKYLLQYRTVTIPHVGTLQIIQHPSQLDVADKKLRPPSFSASLNKEGEVPEHQLKFLNGFLEKDTNAVLEDLKIFGDDLSDKINGPGFVWEGVGWLDRNTQSFTLPVPGLNAVKAERVMRTQPDHKVLVGERQTTSLQIADEKAVGDVLVIKQSKTILAGWILLLITLLAIALLLYFGKFKVSSGGSRLSPSSYIVQ